MSLSPYYEPHEGGDPVFSVEATKIKFGFGAINELGADAEALGMKNVVLFTDKRVAATPQVDKAVASLKAKGIKVTVYDEVEVEPTDRSFKKGIAFVTGKGFDGFVSVGGGSVMDTCKASNLYSTYPPEDFLDYVNAPLGKAVPVPGPLKPHIACPTTFGTASECTGISVFDFLELKSKTGIVSPMLKPRLGILDPNALKTLPPLVRAANGLDVFSHSFESFTARPHTQRPAPADVTKRPLSQGANPYSDVACAEAIRLIGENLAIACKDPQDHHFEALMFAGMLAGIGFGNAGCQLPHGMSYAVAGMVRDFQPDGWSDDHPIVPHGISVIVNSPAVFRLTGPACPERHLLAAKAMGVDTSNVDLSEAGNLLSDAIIDMMKATDIPNGLKGLGYNEGDVEKMAEMTWQQKRLIDNAPLKVTQDQLKQLFTDALSYW